MLKAKQAAVSGKSPVFTQFLSSFCSYRHPSLFKVFLSQPRTLGGIDFNFDQLIRFSHALLLVLAITLATLIDFRELIIPDQITLSLIFSSPLVAVIHPDLDLRSSLLGAGLDFQSFTFSHGPIFCYVRELA